MVKQQSSAEIQNDDNDQDKRLEESHPQNENNDSEDGNEDDKGGVEGFEFGEDEAQARNQFLEREALRAQADWAHNQQDGMRMYVEPQKENK
ncbi:hypothetical protein HDU77_011259, partial [Chytriomyces hyalinus]